LPVVKFRVSGIAVALAVALAVVGAGAGALRPTNASAAPAQLVPGRVTVLPDDGRGLYFDALDSARHDIRIEICVLEDPEILQHVETAISRGVRVRAIVDRGKYEVLPAEQANLARSLTGAGGELHLSNPVFPRSFPKVVLVDDRPYVYGSACLDTTTFTQYRDFATSGEDARVSRSLHRLFDRDWASSAPPGSATPAFAPTPPINAPGLIVAPVNASAELTALYQSARRTLDVYSEELGNPALEGELVAAVARGVEVRLIAPSQVNGATAEMDALQVSSLGALASAGVDVHVSAGAQDANTPYMHARAAVVDGATVYLGSVSLALDSATVNREVGVVSRARRLARTVAAQFATDFATRTKPYTPKGGLSDEQSGARRLGTRA
jgi:cardiolipin synthase A/B